MKLLRIPRPWLYAGILVFATMGAYTLNNNVVDLVILWVIGILGFGMRVLDVPVAPCVVGLILGPLAEQQFRRALSISQGDASVFFTHPISLALLTIAVLLVIAPDRAAPPRRRSGRRGRLTAVAAQHSRCCIATQPCGRDGSPPPREDDLSPSS